MKRVYKKPHIMIVFGTRPEVIKLAPIIRALRERSVCHAICNTAQHREMLDTLLEAFDISPDVNLSVMRENQTISHIHMSVLSKVEEILTNIRPDLALVQGDTTTAFVASLASFYKGIEVGHLEAGLRTNDKYNPFPEEINRRLITVIAGYHFCPTKLARENLLKEGIAEESIFVTGNTVIDSLFYVLELLRNDRVKVDDHIKRQLDQKMDSRIILVTAHRRENFGPPIERICNALRELALEYSNDLFIYPVHLNPNIQKPVYEMLDNVDNVWLINPPDYFTFVYLMKRSYLILTDSGGIQEEAPSLGKPVLVLRDKTERPEGVAAGVVKIVGTHRKNIVEETSKLLNNGDEYQKMAMSKNPYGDGRSAPRIVDIILSRLC